ncbi:hypothetical protein [Halopseudomonas maritima]|uniref:hypothetical protein n=1 Tax=Halopseudomonas maritima TaxID=2918528 RepID=UPI001EEB7F45|nr:hypothetical protein [Halopseudomonas maritima]UJJ32989.1 hypothetical protein HV822_07545 [Halopseudomonas maritima]
MNIAGLKRRIAEATAQSDSQEGMQAWLQTRIADLHPAIRLQADPVGHLQRFATAYIEQVPDVLEAAAAVAESASLKPRMLPVLKVAEAFFLQPPDLPAEHRGLVTLLDEAYLAHRLVEEVNDRYVSHGGESLIPMDTTRANLIVHHLLGEPFANRLDAAVEEAVAGLLPEDLFQSAEFQAYRAQLDSASVQRLWAQWPCMSQQLGVDIELRGAI